MRTGLAARRRLHAAAIIALGAFGFVAFGGTARATVSACTRASGVTVIVEYTRGTIERGCAPGHPANGLAALEAAGFSYDGTAQYGDAFVCRIDGNPTDQACASTPPPDAYWAYYHARATDAGWTYWGVGAAQSTPAPGSIEAWAFGANVQPSVAPGAVAPPPPPPTTRPAPTVPVAAAGTVAVTTGTATVVPPARGLAAPTVTEPSSRVTTAATAAPTTTVPARSTTTPSATAAPRAVHIVDRAAAPPAPARSGSGSPLPAVFAVVALAVAGTASFFVVRARRRAAS